MKILQINSSILGENSVSTQYANKISEMLQLKNKDSKVLIRDVAKEPVTQLSGTIIGQLRNMENQVAREYAALIEEIKSADTIVLTAPMYNFTIPGTLKNYFDAIIQAGVTFNYTENGPVGHLTNKKVYVVLTRGGQYKDKISFQEDFLKTMLGFIGLTDIQFIYVEGLAMGLSKESIEAQAMEQINKLN